MSQGNVVVRLPVESVEFVKELYPRLREDDAAIERYRHALDRLPPIVVARGRVLVDGFHRWQAHRREKAADIAVIDLGNLTDAEIFNESIRRNAAHGQQLSARDKENLAGKLWVTLAHLEKGDRTREIAELLAVGVRTVELWTKDARKAEKEQQKAKALDLWLDCLSERDVADRVGVTQPAINEWVKEFRNTAESYQPDPIQTFDVWSFQKADDSGTASHFGRMPGQVVENLLWLFTKPGDIVFDPFAGGGTTIEVAKRMGRRVWSSYLNPATPTLPIHKHDITKGWPDAAPKKADFILLDPPYWQQAKGRYSDATEDLGNVTLAAFRESWAGVVKTCKAHLSDAGHLAFIVSPTQLEDGKVIDHAFEMYSACVAANLTPVRRVIVPYQTQQATGQQVQWAKDNKRLLKLYRDLGVFSK